MKTGFLVLTMLAAPVHVACATETVIVFGLHGASTLAPVTDNLHGMLPDATSRDSSFDLWTRANPAHSGNEVADDEDSLSLNLRKYTA